MKETSPFIYLAYMDFSEPLKPWAPWILSLDYIYIIFTYDTISGAFKDFVLCIILMFIAI